MIWLAIAILALLFEGFAVWRKVTAWMIYGRIALCLGLISLILNTAGAQAFANSEAGLLGWFVLGLIALLAGAVFLLSASLARFAPMTVPIAALPFALGFDFTRPDEYAYVPAAILATLVLIVVLRAHSRLAPLNGKRPSTQDRIGLALKIFLVGVLVYAGIYKVIDRGWPLPWSYMAAGGALLFAAAQLQVGYAKLKRKKTPLLWVWSADVAVTLMVSASYFIYSAFL